MCHPCESQRGVGVKNGVDITPTTTRIYINTHSYLQRYMNIYIYVVYTYINVYIHTCVSFYIINIFMYIDKRKYICKSHPRPSMYIECIILRKGFKPKTDTQWYNFQSGCLVFF